MTPASFSGLSPSPTVPGKGSEYAYRVVAALAALLMLLTVAF